ncbi:MAG: DUF2326 domain-containing protein [Candidatus Electrothrix sp. YB6]
MKIIELAADQSSFKSISFNPVGLTLILGDGAKDPKEEGSSNGVGKTLALGLIHHCLGANANKKLQHAVPDWIFRLRFSVNSTEHLVERSGNGKQLLLDGNAIKLTKYRQWLNECGAFHIDDELPGLSFRSLFSRFARLLRSDCEAPVKTHKENPFDAQLRSLYLLGIDCFPVASKKKYKTNLDELKKSISLFERDQVLRDIFRTGIKPKVRIDWLDREIPKLRTDLESFEVADNYHELILEADSQTKKLRELEKQAAALRFQLDGIKKLLNRQPDISNCDLQQLYSGLSHLFQPEALRHFEAVENFHKKLTENRETRLAADKKRIINKIKRLEEKIQEQGRNRDNLLRVLNGKRAIDEYKALVAQLAGLEEEHARLKEYMAFAQKLEQQKQTIKEKMLEENKEAAEFTQTEPLRQHEFVYAELVEQLYPHTPAGIVLENNSSDRNQIRYDLSVEIQGDDSDGINDARILCFDWLMLTLGSHHSMGFLWHDNRLFANVCPKVRAAWFTHVATNAERIGKQYIASLNTENYQAMRPYLTDEQINALEKAVALKLTGDNPENKLLGIQFGGTGGN